MPNASAKESPSRGKSAIPKTIASRMTAATASAAVKASSRDTRTHRSRRHRNKGPTAITANIGKRKMALTGLK